MVQSPQDKTADTLLGSTLSSSPTVLDDGNLTAVRIETTKVMMLEGGNGVLDSILEHFLIGISCPVQTLSAAMEVAKKVDSRVGFSQGMLEEVSHFFFFAVFFLSLLFLLH